MSTIGQPSGKRDDRREGVEAAVLANLHRIYRGDLCTLQVAIASATGEQRRRLEQVLVNLRCEKR